MMEPPPKKPMITRPRQLSDIQESMDLPVDRRALNQGTSFLLSSPPAIHSISSANLDLNLTSAPYKFSQLRYTSAMTSINTSSPLREHHLRPLSSLNPNIPSSPSPTSAPVSLPQFSIPCLYTSPAASDSGCNSPAMQLRPASAQSNHYLQTTGSPSNTTRRGRQRMREAASRTSLSSTSINTRQGTPHPRNKASVKHLTCYWWKEKGQCKFSEPDCLYSHHDTGVYADAPKQVTPGEPALAGKKLERALKNLSGSAATHHGRSDSSLTNLESASTYDLRPNTPARTPEAGGIHGNNVGYVSYTDKEITQLEDDVVLFRGIVEQDIKQKAVMVTAIASLQEENKNLKSTTASLTADNSALAINKAALTEENDMLRNILTQYSNPQGRAVSAPLNPWGPVGQTARPRSGIDGGSNGDAPAHGGGMRLPYDDSQFP